MLDPKIRSSSGMGLLEVVIASAILVIIALGISTVVVNGNRSAQSVQKHISSGELQDFITQTLNNPQLCTATFAGQNAPTITPPGNTVPTISFAGMKMDDTVNSLFANGQIKIASLKYKSVTNVGSLYSAVIELKVNLAGVGTEPVVGGATAPPVDFPLVVTVNALGKIVSCGYTASGPGVVAAISFNAETNFIISAYNATYTHGGCSGVYNITFPSPLPNANYFIAGTTGGPSLGPHMIFLEAPVSPASCVDALVGTQTTTGFSAITISKSGGSFDSPFVSFVIYQ